MGWFLPLAVRRAAFFSALCPERRAQPRLPADVSSWGSECLESRCLTASGAAAAAGQGPPLPAPWATSRVLHGGSRRIGGLAQLHFTPTVISLTGGENKLLKTVILLTKRLEWTVFLSGCPNATTSYIRDMHLCSTLSPFLFYFFWFNSDITTDSLNLNPSIWFTLIKEKPKQKWVHLWAYFLVSSNF